MGKQFEWEQLSAVNAQTKENLRPCQGLRSNRRERAGEGLRWGEEGRGALAWVRRAGLFQKCIRKGDNFMLLGQVIFVGPRLLPTGGAPQRCSTLVTEDSISRVRARWGWDQTSSAGPIYKARFLQSFQAVNTTRGPKLSYCSAYQVQLFCVSQH